MQQQQSFPSQPQPQQQNFSHHVQSAAANTNNSMHSSSPATIQHQQPPTSHHNNNSQQQQQQQQHQQGFESMQQTHSQINDTMHHSAIMMSSPANGVINNAHEMSGSPSKSFASPAPPMTAHYSNHMAQQMPPPVSSQSQMAMHPDQQSLQYPSSSASFQATNPMHVQHLERVLDLNPFLAQLEHLMASAIKVPADSLPHPSTSGGSARPQNVFSVRNIWKDDEEQKSCVSDFYNFGTIRKRKWLKNILLEESDSESDGEQAITETDLHTLLKIHRCRRKYQKNYHEDILNSQYTYYGAGLLSDYDKFPKHQQFIQEQYGFVLPPAPTTEVTDHTTDVVNDVVDFVTADQPPASVIDVLREPMMSSKTPVPKPIVVRGPVISPVKLNPNIRPEAAMPIAQPSDPAKTLGIDKKLLPSE